MDGKVIIGPSGNKVELIDPGKSTYVPKIAAASAADRAKAQKWLDGVNSFCRNHTAAGIKSRWQSGTSNPSSPTHYFNPDHQSAGMHPANPKAALIYDGKLDGVMFTGKPLPYLGSIPRAHSHYGMGMSMSMEVEMVHVYCTANLKDAYTPNRTIGVLGDLRELRDIIRPAILDLNKAQLRAVRTMVRGYAGDELQPVEPIGSSGDGGPDPVKQAMRTEIRHSLMLLTEHQLRNVWSLMQSY